MANRSTRNKIRFQVFAANGYMKEVKLLMDKVNDRLAYAAALADERSDFINENLPPIMNVVDELSKAIKRFYEGL
jgi:hypothetical protein